MNRPTVEVAHEPALFSTRSPDEAGGCYQQLLYGVTTMMSLVQARNRPGRLLRIFALGVSLAAVQVAFLLFVVL